MGSGVNEVERAELAFQRAELSKRYLKPRADRPASSARGIHHTAHISSDIERTVKFMDGVLGFPLIEMFENRDYQGSPPATAASNQPAPPAACRSQRVSSRR